MLRRSRSGLLLGTALHGALAVLLLPRLAAADPRPDAPPPAVAPAPLPPTAAQTLPPPSRSTAVAPALPHPALAPAARPMALALADTRPVGPGAATQVRAADHPGYSRVVFEFPAPPGFAVTREGNRVVAHFSGIGAADIPGLATRLRYVGGVFGGDGRAAIELAPGAVIRLARLDRRVVIDVMPPPEISLAATGIAAPGMEPPPVGEMLAPPLHPGAGGPPPRPARPHAAAAPPPRKPRHPSETAREHPGQLPAVPPPAAAPVAAPAAQAAPAPQPAPVVPVVPDPQAAAAPPPAGSGQPMAAPPAPPTVPPPPATATAGDPANPAGGGHAVTLPFAVTTGAAAFRRGDSAVVVFDERRAIDMAGLQDDSVFGAATIQLLPDATVLRVKLDPDMVLKLTRLPAGWNLAAVHGPGRMTPIAPLPIEGNVSLLAAQPGQVVTVPDTETGWNLLVGTQLRPGQGMAVVRRSPAYVLVPTWQGVVVEPRSDRLAMRPVTDGFMLSAPGEDLAVPSVQPGAQTLANAAGLTRSFDFPAMPDEVLLRRMQQFVNSAASEPPLSRFQARRDAAQAMIALGLGVEAQTMLRLAITDDPQHADDPDVHGLYAIASLLADRDDEADGLDDPLLTGTDEVALWRAVRAARKQEGSPAAAPVFAATLPLLLSYPTALRERLLPLAAETMALGGAADVAAALIASPDAAGIDLSFAAGLVAQVHGDTDGALAIFDRLSNSPDQLLAARAQRRAVELRLSAGRITPVAAADALTKQFLNWREDNTERTMRLRAAALYAQGGAWHKSIDLLHETTGLFPDSAPEIRRQMVQTFTAMLEDAAAKDKAGHGEAAISSFDLVTMVNENPDLIPPGPEGDKLAGLLADRLLALDLPRRAAPVLDKLMRGAPAGAARAGLGARLGEVRLQGGDPAAALVALSDSDAEGLPPALTERRMLLAARAFSAQGDSQRALASLSTLDTAAADDLRATLLSDTKDWHGAEAALTDLAAKTLPADGPLNDDQQNLVLRLAGAAAQAGDNAALKDMAIRLGPRMANKQLSDMFRLLTASPVTGMADMPSVTNDIARARALPSSLAAVGAK